VKCRK